MKRLLVGLIIFACVCGMGHADTATYTLNAVQGTGYTSGVINASGWLDKIEFAQEADSTCTVVVATYDSSVANAIDTYATLSANTDSTKVVRPRLIGTSNAGTALAAVVSAGGTNVTTQLIAAYERPMIGGNTRVKITQGNVTGLTNSLTVTIFYEPLKK